MVLRILDWAGLKPPAQCMEALRAGTRGNARESAEADFHELSEGFIPNDEPAGTRSVLEDAEGLKVRMKILLWKHLV